VEGNRRITIIKVFIGGSGMLKDSRSGAVVLPGVNGNDSIGTIPYRIVNYPPDA
jgi:hypothetical protein